MTIEPAQTTDLPDQKLFDNYGPVNVRETIGTVFLGILAILLLFALQRAWDRMGSKMDKTRPGSA